MQFTGRISKVQAGGSHGWISHKTMRETATGYAYSLTHKKKDVFVHVDDCGDLELEKDLEVTFQLTKDPVRSGGLRAIDVECLVREDHIELHVDANQLDNPSIPLRWCLSPEMHTRIINGTKKGYVYALLFTLRHDDDQYGRKERRELKKFDTPFSFVTVSCSGKWKVGVILYERQVVDVYENNETLFFRQLRSKFLKRDSFDGRSYWEALPEKLHLDGLSAEQVLTESNLVGGSPDYGQPIASEEIIVNIPEGIFAAEPSATEKAFANFFFVKKPFDECEFRKRFLMMVFVGWVPWLLAQLLRRSGQFILGAIQFLFACKGSFSNVLRAFKPAVDFVIIEDLPQSENDQKRYRPWNSKIGFWLTPGMIAVATAVGYLLVKLWAVVSWAILSLLAWLPWMIFILWLIPAIVVIFFSVKYGEGIRLRLVGEKSWDEKVAAAEATLAAKQAALLSRSERKASLLVQTAPAMVCGQGSQHEVSLKAVPKELRTFSLRFQALKRTVCRPFGS